MKVKCALSFINAQNVKPVVFRRLEIGGPRELHQRERRRGERMVEVINVSSQY